MGIMEKLPDAIVLASVLSYLDGVRSEAPQPICFVTPDEAFGAQPIVDLLRGLECKYLRSFSDAAAWIQKYSRPSN